MTLPLSVLTAQGLPADNSAPQHLPRQADRHGSGLGSARMEVLRTTGLLDSATRAFWDGLTSLAAKQVGVPLAVIAVLDGATTLTLSHSGDASSSTAQLDDLEAMIETCVLAIQGVAPSTGGCWETSDCCGAGVLRAWLTWPLTSAGGEVVGAFGLLDRAGRIWSEADKALVGILARSASTQLSLLAASDAARIARDDLARLRESERRAEERLKRLAAVALELLRAEKVEDLTEIVVNRGLPVLGADGGAVVVRADDRLAAAVSHRLGPRVQVAYAELPLDDPLPAAYVARTGKRLVLPTRASGLAFAPEMGPLYESSHRSAWVFTPLWVGNRLLGSLAASWVDEREFSDDDLSVLDAFGAQCAQALERIRLTQAQHDSAVVGQRLSEALQRSLLSYPATDVDLDFCFRYLPAVQDAHVGGDWYDAFEDSRGATIVVVGDVAGHDGSAAAAMAQLRNLLRGLAFDSHDSPALLLGRLDRAAIALGLDTLATAVVARIGLPDADGGREVLWSSAGHVPPLLRLADRSVCVLAGSPDLLLGLDGATSRADHAVRLPDGGGLLLYTDGLVERRDEDLDVGVRRLAGVLAALEGTAEQIGDQLIAALLPAPPEDDVAMLLVQRSDQH